MRTIRHARCLAGTNPGLGASGTVVEAIVRGRKWGGGPVGQALVRVGKVAAECYRQRMTMVFAKRIAKSLSFDCTLRFGVVPSTVTRPRSAARAPYVMPPELGKCLARRVVRTAVFVTNELYRQESHGLVGIQGSTFPSSAGY